jgi:site-specific recombinase XerC
VLEPVEVASQRVTRLGGVLARRRPPTASPVESSNARTEHRRSEQRRTKAAQVYKKTGNLRAVQLLLGHTKLESSIEVDDALSISEQVEL